MIEQTAAFLNENNIKNKTVLAAVSGGVDSSVLFYILNTLKDDFNLDLKVIHLNHNWRGEESLKDMNFVHNLANEAGCEFYAKTLEDDVKKTELDARDARYSFFEEALNKFNSDICFLAHNKNDNVETLIYRMIKGTGVSGLSAIPKIRIPYYRPLLDFSRDEIEEFAKAHNILFREDKSNSDIKYKRNFIRRNILPQMEKINDNILNSISSLINLVAENTEILDNYIASVEQNIYEKNSESWYFKRPTIIRAEFLSLKPALQREILSRYFKGILKNRDFKTILKIQNFIRDNEDSTLSISADAFLKVWKGTVFLYKKDKKGE